MTNLPAHSDSPEKEVKPWKTLSSEIALNEKWFMVRKEAVQMPNGQILNDYFMWDSPNIAVIVPFTTDGQFVICQQWRHGAGKLMYQFPAGAIDKGESPKQAALREMLEETGYTAKDEDVTHLVDTAAYATKLTGWQHIFLAQNAVYKTAPANDPTEVTKVLLKSPAELLAMIEAGQFQIPDSLSAALLALRKLGF